MTDPKQARCLDPEWKFYRDTDLDRTFRRVRRQMKEAEQAKPIPVNVRPIKKGAAK
jgi:hypothetical protein